MGIVRTQSVNLTGGETPDRLIGSFVSAGTLPMPARWIVPEGDSEPRREIQAVST